MLLKVDFFFSYKYVLRFVLIQQYGFFFNTFQIPFLKNLLIFFSINDLEDLDDARSFNYFYLFKFFFGNKSFFTRFRSFFSLGKTYYSFNIQSFFSGRFCFFPLFFLINDLLALTNSNHYKIFYLAFDSVSFSFFDLNLFLEKKTNVGLFSLRDCLNFRFIFSCSDFVVRDLLLHLFKTF
jgi:hypothetical protein